MPACQFIRRWHKSLPPRKKCYILTPCFAWDKFILYIIYAKSVDNSDIGTKGMEKIKRSLGA
jgi:hypothetical protein